MNKTISLFVFLLSFSTAFSQEKCKNLEKGAVLYQLIEDGIDFSFQKNNVDTENERVTIQKMETDAINFTLKHFEKTIRQKPNTLCEATAFFYCAVLHKRLKKYDTSISFFEKFLEKNLIKQHKEFKNFRETYKGKANYLLAKIYYEKEIYKKANNHIKSAKNWYLGAYSQLYDKEEYLRTETQILNANILLKLKKPKKAITHLFNNIFHAKKSNIIISNALTIVETNFDANMFLLKMDNAMSNYKKETFGIMTIYSVQLLDKKIELPFSWFKNVTDKEIANVLKSNVEKSYFYAEVLKLITE